MTNKLSGMIVLTDGASNYYVLTPELLTAAKATHEQQAAIEQALAEADTSGFIFLHESIPTVATSPAATIPVYNDLASAAGRVQTGNLPSGLK